jgi:hypothetical protein
VRHPLAEGCPRSRWLTAKLTANRVNSCRSLATSADEHELSSCIDGWQRTALDGRGRVRSSPVAAGHKSPPSGCGRPPARSIMPRLPTKSSVLTAAPGSSSVKVAAAPPAVRFGPELAFQLHQALDPGAVGGSRVGGSSDGGWHGMRSSICARSRGPPSTPPSSL